MHTSLKSSFILGATAVVAISLFACTPKQPVVTLPVGPQTLTGSLSPVELSLNRRGTHVFRQMGNDIYYVESSTVNLRPFEGMDVVITGNIEKNTDSAYLPVLVATNVTLISEPSHLWTVASLHITFSAPLAWNGDVFDDGVIFTQTGSEIPLLKIHRSSLSQLPTGSPLIIGGERAVLVTSGSGQVVYVQSGQDVIAVELDKSLMNAEGTTPVRSVLLLLKSIGFTNSSSSSFGSSAMNGADSSLSVSTDSPCGGPAGILCPAGSYCAITDTTLGIGTCHQIPPPGMAP